MKIVITAIVTCKKAVIISNICVSSKMFIASIPVVASPIACNLVFSIFILSAVSGQTIHSVNNSGKHLPLISSIKFIV